MSKSQEDSITPERFAQIRGIFEAALDRRPYERRAFIDGACAGDAKLLRDVLDMLAAEGVADALLDGKPPSSAPEEGRFPAGTVLAGRYRILGLLGSGGMGEVYRSHDVILNQLVALKFMSPAHISEAALNRFRNEVRVARQVSHPNVCRVYDLGMVDGWHFLSMEYIDGEDLASLLRRIGRLPQDKAIEFTRKICAGLSAAHERGVLHRDLKPANIMIDGRGQPRITDFGLAALAQEIPLSDLRSGTPAYMSPEQKAGKEVTTRSDLYSLGLVLHEMFTGKARKDSRSSPSELVKDLDPAIERLILRCLEEEPRRRPSSAFNIAMALPGADPIAAALAAGETPSPEMVAASQEQEGFSPRTAVLCFAAVVIASVFAITSWFGLFNSQLLQLAPVDNPPDVLAFQAREILKKLGYTETVESSAYGFDCCDAIQLRYVNAQNRESRNAILASHQPPVIRFWYRQHQDLLLGAAEHWNRPFPGITYDSPPNAAPGMVRLMLDATGRLVGLEVRPVHKVEDDARGPAEFDWSSLFSVAGLDPARFKNSPPRELPSMPFDARAAWTGQYDENRTEQVHVEAAAWRGRPVYFSVIAGDNIERESTVGISPKLIPFLIGLLVTTFVAAALTAIRNVRAGRGDRKGAAKIVGAVFLCGMAAWFLTVPHVSSAWELQLLVTEIATSAFTAGMLWLSYMAVEPYMRKHWPHSLISWNRVQSGRFRDLLVASHILAGITAWILITVVILPILKFLPVAPPEFMTNLDSAARFAAFLVSAPVRMFTGTIVFLVMVVVLRFAVQRRVWIADILAIILFGLTGPIVTNSPYHFVTTGVIVFTAVYTFLWLIRRFGFLAMLAAWFVRSLLSPFGVGSWYFGRELVVGLIPVVLAAWALWVILSVKHRPILESAETMN